MIELIDIGKRITELRKERNITTNKLANKAGISQSYLRDIELGKKNPTVEMLSYVCYALNISLKDFFSVNETALHPFLITALEKLSEAEQIKLADFINELKK